jgi:Flp pilus assembly protein TadG
MSCSAQKRLVPASAPTETGAAHIFGFKRVRARLSEFAGDTEGTVMMTFGLMAIAMFAMVGGAVDLGRWLNARDQTMSAIDAAVLSAGRALQTGATPDQAKQIAMNYYVQNTKSRLSLDDDTVSFTVSADKTTVTAAGSAHIRTPFMALANVESLPLFTGPEAPEASIAQRSHSGLNREVSLMLDVSGSMCSPCTKRDDMKAAAADLISILLPETQGEFWTKIAVVPFSGDVRPPASILSQVVPPITNVSWPKYRSFATGGGGANNNNGNGNSGNGNSGSGNSGSGNSGNGNSGSGNSGNGNSGGGNNDDDDDAPTFNYYRSACVGERQGQNKHTDEAASPTSNFLTPTYVEKSSVTLAYYNANMASVASSLCSTPVSGTVLPLTSDKTTLLNMVGGLTTGGGTAGHVGTAWAYYMISPEWSAIVPDGSEAVAYGTPKVKKIAILMTDGEYNYTYDNKGIRVGNNNAGPSANGNSSSGQSIAICNQMKQDGIEVYTVGFDLGGNQNAINTLKNCASDKDKAYIAENGAALKSVFRDIAIKLTDLHLSK